jgi:hypothetical protein
MAQRSNTAAEYHVTVKEHPQSHMSMNASLTPAISDMSYARHLDSRTELLYLKIITGVMIALALLALGFCAFSGIIWDAGEKLYLLLVCGLVTLIVAIIGLYGTNLVMNDLEFN